MRVLFLFLLFTSFGFGQQTDVDGSNVILGTWWLNTIETEQFVDNHTEVLTSGVDVGYSLTITEDSVIFNTPPLRFYTRKGDAFSYSVSYDTLLGQTNLNLFVGKGKHKVKQHSYSFKLVNGQLILSILSDLNLYPGSFAQLNYFTYSKAKDEDRLYEKMHGSWIVDGESLDFIYTESSDTIYFVKRDEHPEFGCYTSFVMEQGVPKLYNECSFGSDGAQEGVFYSVYVTEIPFTIDLTKKQLILHREEDPLIFDIGFINDEEMRLIIHQE